MSDIDPDPGFYTKTSCIQLMYGVWVNMATLAVGLVYGFPVIQIPQLNSPESDILVTIEEGSWIASINTLFCPLGCLISGYMMDKVGRRIPLLSSQIPMFCGWLCTGVAMSARNIIIGRAVTGVGCGMAMGVPRLYTSEISLANMRGLLGALPNIFLSIGITIQAAMGSFIEWKKICYICCLYNIILFFSYLFLQESPQYVLLNNSETMAKRALAYFRSKSYPIDKEINRMMMFKQDNDIRSLKVREKIKALFKRTSYAPFCIAMTYVMFVCISGVPAVTIWTIHILMLTNSSFDVHAGNFLIALTRLVFGTLASALLFNVGRRPMALCSASGVGSSSLILAIFLSYYRDPSIAPQILIMTYIGFASLGYQCVPFLLMSEMYPLQVRGTIIGISLTLTNIMIFTTTKCFPYLEEGVGIINTLFIYGSCSFVAIIFLYFLLPETKGLTLEQIEEYFRQSRHDLAAGSRVIQTQISDISVSTTMSQKSRISESVMSLSSRISTRIVQSPPF